LYACLSAAEFNAALTDLQLHHAYFKALLSVFFSSFFLLYYWCTVTPGKKININNPCPLPRTTWVSRYQKNIHTLPTCLCCYYTTPLF